MIAKVTYDIQKGNVGRNNELMDWLKSLKNRVQPQPKEWSEEDEKMYKVALSCIETLEDIKNGKNRYADVKEWLKSLEDRATWKPSDEQMEIFKELIDDNSQRFFYPTLKSLYNDLKKLKEK